MTDTATRQPAIIPCGSCGKLNRVDLLRTDELAKCGSCRAELALDAPIALTDATFDRVVGATAVPVVIDFFAEWCGPCKQMAPVFAELARRQRGQSLIAKVDTDRSPGVAARFAIRGIPTIVVMRDGREVARQVGAVPMGALENLVRNAALA